MALADINSTADPTWRAFRRRLSVAAYKRCNCLAERPEKSQNSRSVVSFGSRLSATRWISDSADFFLRPMLEYDMATFTRSQKLLVSAGAAALGGAALATLLAGNIVTLAGAGATAVDISPPFVDPDFPVCHTPAGTGLPNMMLRLAQTEVPRAEISAASSAPAFVETEPPLWGGLGSITYK